MLTCHAAGLLRLCALLALVLPALPGHVAAAPPTQGMRSPLMHYHELIQRPDGSSSIEDAILSGDGRRAFWLESRGVPKVNRLFALDIDGGQPNEIDVYQTLCACQTRVEVSDDAGTVVSTDGMRIRILAGVATFGTPREVLRLAENVISAMRISGDGKIVVFMVVRDTSIFEPNPFKRGALIPRGVWAMNADGEAPIHLAGVEEIAAATGAAVAELQADPDFASAEAIHALDVSDDGGRIIFGAHAGAAGDAVFSLTGDAPLNKLYGLVGSVGQTAVSGDGQTVAFMTETQGSSRVLVISGGILQLAPLYSMVSGERLQLSRDGSTLLGKGPAGAALVEVATLTPRRLFLTLPGSPLDGGQAIASLQWCSRR